MPNHVTNRLTITGPENIVAQCLASIGEERAQEKSFDGKPMFNHRSKPHCFAYQSDGGLVDRDGKPVQAEDYEPSMYDTNIAFERIVPTPKIVSDLSNGGDISMDVIDANRGRNWYHWNIKHWGTKWSAYNQSKDDHGRLLFDTAWSAPEPVMCALSELFGELSFKLESFDEGYCFATIARYQSGDRRVMCDWDGKGEMPGWAKELCVELKGYDPDNRDDDDDSEPGEEG